MSTTPPAGGSIPGRALRLALALPLVCAVVVGALFVGQQLRAARDGAYASAQPSAQAGAAAAAQEPIQRLRFPMAVVPQNVSASPDGRHVLARTADWKQTLLLRVVPDPNAADLNTELVADVTDVAIDAWLPDATGFVGHGQAPLPPGAGPAQMKTYHVYVVATDGSRRSLGDAQGLALLVDRDGKWVSALDGNNGVIAFPRDGSATKVLAPPTGSLSFLGWDADLRLVHQSWTPPMELRRIGLDGTATKTPLPQNEHAGGQATWSPDHRAALVTLVRDHNELPGLLTDHLAALPTGALQTWVGPHDLLWRAADGRIGVLDALTGATRVLTVKMKTDKPRVLGASAPYVLWIDESAGRIHITDLATHRDTTLGLSPLPERAQPLVGGRFLLTRGTELSILDGGAWFRQVPPTPAPIPTARDQSGVPTGMIRTESRDGGWSVVHPASWFRRAQPMRGSDFLSYEPDPDFGGNIPPPGEVRVIVQLMPNFDGLDPRAYAGTAPRVGQITRESNVTIAGQTGYTNTVNLNMSQPPPWPTDTRNWFVRSPYFPDRMLVIQATPAEARITDVDAIVASLRFAPPVVTPQTPISRAQVTAKYAAGAFPVLRLDKIEAKLVTWKEYELAAASFHSGVNDPEQLVWLVLVTGEIAHPRGGPPRFDQTVPTTPPTYPWVLFTVDAVSGDGTGLSCCGPEARPKWFDGLADRGK